jgi:hypothetical protein
LDALIKARRSEDAAECIRSAAADQDLSALPDEVRYQLALQMSNAMVALYDQSRPLPKDARVTADLWQAYLEHVREPIDAARLAFGTQVLLQQGRYGKLEERLPVLLSAVQRAAPAMSGKQADLLFSTLKRCPRWDTLSTRLACTAACKALAESATSTLERHFGSHPWTGSPGLAKLSQNTRGLKDEAAACTPTP